MINTLHCTILTPERVLFEGDVGFAVVQAHNGEMGFLFDHSPIISELGYGEARLLTEKTRDLFVVEGGVVEVRDNNMIVLAERAFAKDELDIQDIEKKLKELSERTYKKFSEEHLTIQAETQLLKIRLKVAKR